MKSTVKAFLAYLFGAMLLIFSRNLIPILSGKLHIADGGKYRMLCVLFLIGAGISVALFALLKRKDPEVKGVMDLFPDEEANPYALAIPGKRYEGYTKPVTFWTMLGVFGVLCVLRVLLLEPSLNRANLLGDLDTRAMFWKSIWWVLACPVAEGILHRGLLQRNLMKYGTAYAILFSALAFWLSRLGCAYERGMLIYALFYGVLAARYGFALSLNAEFIHLFCYVLPSLLPLRILFKNGGMMYSAADLLDKAAFIGAGLFITYLLVYGTVRLVKFCFSEKPGLVFTGRTAALKADGTMTVLFLAALYFLVKVAQTMVMQVFM